MKFHFYFIGLFFLLTISCNDNDLIPKPKAQLRLIYQEPVYQKIGLKYLSFKKSDQAVLEKKTDTKFNLYYPKLKAKIYMTYFPVQNNLDSLLRDAEKFTYEHTIKADEILRKDFINNEKKVYGSINLVTGNAASQIQFHATDSIKNFLNGSLYFYALPNYDSIYPAVKYLQKDVKVLLESLEWKK